MSRRSVQVRLQAGRSASLPPPIIIIIRQKKPGTAQARLWQAKLYDIVILIAIY